MFDIGFSEILLTAVVALLVLGPERLPKAARFAGLWVRRARAQWDSVKAELENELVDEDLRLSIRKARSELRDGLDATRDAIRFTSIDGSPNELVAIDPGVHVPQVIDAMGRPETPSEEHAQTAIVQRPHDTEAPDIAFTEVRHGVRR